jgi:Alginate lyase
VNTAGSAGDASAGNASAGTGAGGATTSGIQHPGALHTQADLARVRAGVSAATEPWASAWKAAAGADAGKTYQPNVKADITDVYALQNQGHAAYVLAVKWVASGDNSYAQAAIRVLDAWVSTVKRLDANNTTLRTGIGAVQLANAAEIIAYGFGGAAGWPDARVAQAKVWFSDVVWPHIAEGVGQRSSNWGTSALAGCMSVAIFSGDQTKLDYAIAAFENGFTDTADGCAGVAQYICNAAGQATEAGRDQGHAQGGVGHLVETALMAFNQGHDLVSYADHRLLAGMEYLAKYNLGHDDVPYDPNFADPCNVHPAWPTISLTGRGSFSPVYEMAHHLFKLAQLSDPYTAQVLQAPGYAPENTNSDHPGLGTLTAR